MAKAKFWREFDVRPIANSEWMAAMMRRSPLFEGMEIPVVPPIVDDIFFSTTDYTIERRGRCEMEQPEVDPKGERVGTNESNIHGLGKEEAGLRLGSQTGAAFSNPSASEIARDSETTSPIRSAFGPASLLDTSHTLPATASPATSYSLPVTAPGTP